jgi:hypothetical protein
LKQIDPNSEVSVVGIEPPEIYCLKNDYFDMLPNRKEEVAQRVSKVWLLDEFLLRSDKFKALRVGKLDDVTLPKGHRDDVSEATLMPHASAGEGLYHVVEDSSHMGQV